MEVQIQASGRIFFLYVVRIGTDKTLAVQEADRVYGDIRTADHSPDQRFKTQPVTMTDTIAFGSEWRETSARLHGARARKRPTPTHASTLSTLPPTNSRVVTQSLTDYLPSKSHFFSCQESRVAYLAIICVCRICWGSSHEGEVVT